MSCSTGDKSEMSADHGTEEVGNTSLASIWETFTQSTGFHGVNKITFNTRDSRRIVRSVCWVIVWLVCAMYLTYTVMTELKSYYSYPTFLNTFVEFHDRLRFPTVTVCNLNSRNKSAFSNNPKTNNLFMRASALRDYGTPINWSDPFYKEKGYFEKQTFEDYKAQSKNIWEFLYGAIFDTYILPEITSLFKPALTDMGLCLRANEDGTVSSSMYGALFNMHLYINIITNEDYFSNVFSSGVKVAIHDYKHEPIMMNEGIVIQPATEAFIEIQKKEHRFLPSPYTVFGQQKCLDDDNYSYSKCYQDCMNKIILDKCGCVDFLSKETVNGTFCSIFEYLTCFDPLYWKLVLTNTTDICNCPLSCRFTTYDYTYSTGKFPSDFVGDQLEKNIDWFKIRENFLVIRNYYKQLTTTVTEQVPKYQNVGAILANLGGQLGLFLGASILTITELLEFLVFLIYTLVQRLIYRSNKTRKHAQRNKIRKIHVSPFNR